MKIAFVTANITNSAGTERVLVNVSNYLVSNGFKIEIHSISSKSGTPYYSLDNRVSYAHYGLANYADISSKLLKLYLKITNTFKVRYAFKNINADIVIGVDKHINIYLVLFLPKKQKHMVIGSEHFPHNVHISIFSKITRRLCYPYLDGFVALTEYDKLFYKTFVKNVVCIPNSYSFFPDQQSNSQSKIVLSIGRHTEQKGFDMLIRTWVNVVASNPDWQLFIVGTGPLLQAHINLAQSLGVGNSVSFLPPTKNVMELYLSASLYVLPSRYEAFPMVLLEAMACGLSCVCFDCTTGPAEIINNGEDGIIVTPNNEVELAQKLLLLINNLDTRLEMGKKARENIQRYSPEIIGKQWIDFLLQYQ